MKNDTNKGLLYPSLAIFFGLIVAGFLLSHLSVSLKRTERTVTVKGLSEREVPANIAIWPLKFNQVSNDLNDLYSAIEDKTASIVHFLQKNGFSDKEITVSAPTVFDRYSQGYMDSNKILYRYSATTSITVYTENVQSVLETSKKVVELGKQGIAVTGEDYDTHTEFIFTHLNEIKPQMIEEATNNAREVAEKFATDSKSILGKIKLAQQGQFSIRDRDSNTPNIKIVRVVSTIEYYLKD